MMKSKREVAADIRRFVVERGVVACGILSALAIIIFGATSVFAWEYISNTADCMPYMALVFMLLPIFMWIINLLFVRSRIFNTTALVYCVLAIIGYAILCCHILSVLFFVLVEVLPILISAVLIFSAVFIFLSHKASKKCRIAVGCVLLVVFALYILFDLFNLKPNYINANPVVFAVEDEYQICWSTSTTATAAVEVDGRLYYDGDNGVENVSTIHKVCVPRNVLDDARSYTVISQGVIHRRTYVSTLGNEHRKTFDFCPVDCSDGLHFYNFSDNHMQRTGVVNACSYFGENLDFIVANGDQFNNISHEYQVTLVYRTLSKISGSSIPVIMTRGNHETVGSIVDKSDRFMPSQNGKFYYTVRFGDTLFVVLDYATDHADGDATTRPSHFDAYRQEELKWLEQLADTDLSGMGIKHIVALCHISFLRLGSRTKAQECFEFAELTQRMGVELLLSGHSHKTEFLAPYEGYNITSYPAVLGSIRSDRYSDKDSVSEFQFTGTAIEITANGYKLSFTNYKHEIKATYTF